MSPGEVLAARFTQQLESLIPEMESALRSGHRFRISLYKGDDFIGEPQLTVLPSRKVANSRVAVLPSSQ